MIEIQIPNENIQIDYKYKDNMETIIEYINNSTIDINIVDIIELDMDIFKIEINNEKYLKNKYKNYNKTKYSIFLNNTDDLNMFIVLNPINCYTSIYNYYNILYDSTIEYLINNINVVYMLSNLIDTYIYYYEYITIPILKFIKKVLNYTNITNNIIFKLIVNIKTPGSIHLMIDILTKYKITIDNFDAHQKNTIDVLNLKYLFL